MSEHTINDISPIYTMPPDEQKTSASLIQIPDLLTATGGECNWVLQKGSNTGLECNKRCVLNTPRCKSHYDKEQSIEVTPIPEVEVHSPPLQVISGDQGEYKAIIQLAPPKPKITFKVIGSSIHIEVGEHKFEFS